MFKKILVLCLLWSSPLFAANYNYADLQLKNFEEMQSLVNSRVKKAESVANRDVNEAKIILKDAMQLIFSRPNGDNMVSKLLPPIRSTLKNIEAYDSILNEIAVTAIGEVKNENAKVKDSATNLIVLANLMSEIQPEIKTNPAIRNIIIKIRDAKIDVNNKVKGEMRMRSMLSPPTSPSDIAAKILAGK